jgi:hypothetical protein
LFLDKTSHPAAGVPVQDLHTGKGASCKFFSVSLLLLIKRNSLHCKKKVSDFPVPSRDVTNQTLPDRE